MLKQTADGILITLKISPNASKNEIIKTDDGVKIKITAPPVDGKANKALIEFLSKEFKISKTSIEILRGETSKDKTILFKTTDNGKIEIDTCNNQPTQELNNIEEDKLDQNLLNQLDQSIEQLEHSPQNAKVYTKRK